MGQVCLVEPMERPEPAALSAWSQSPATLDALPENFRFDSPPAQKSPSLSAGRPPSATNTQCSVEDAVSCDDAKSASQKAIRTAMESRHLRKRLRAFRDQERMFSAFHTNLQVSAMRKLQLQRSR